MTLAIDIMEINKIPFAMTTFAYILVLWSSSVTK